MDVQSPSALRPLKQVVFRADASIHIGTGHVMRCLTLADALRAQGVQCRFVCRPHEGHLLELIAQRGHEAIALAPPDFTFISPASPPHAAWLGTDWANDAAQTRAALGDTVADWLVVDHYALDVRWEEAVSNTYRHLMVIDDLADRPHRCTLLLDQTLGRKEADYKNQLQGIKTHTLLGPHYALLRPEFAQWRAYSMQRRQKTALQHVLITMGGVDKDNATGRILEQLQKSNLLPGSLELTVVMGPHAPWLQQVKEQATDMKFATHVLVGVNNMAQLMADSDLAIGAAGSTSWERCCLGVPSVILVLAQNQKEGAEALQREGAAVAIEHLSDVPTIVHELLSMQNGEPLRAMSNAAAAVTNGLGLEQVVNRMLTLNA